MKKGLFCITAAICMAVSAFSFAACGSGNDDLAHTQHSWSATYTQDGDRHYQTCSGCTEKNYAPHDFTNGDCVCGKEKPHSHTWSTTYTEDGDRHYQTCGGCEEKNYAPHDYGTSGICVCGKHEPETPPETVNVTSVTLNENELTLDIGDETTLTASVKPDNATDKTVTWAVAPAGVVTVDNGKVTAIADGTATITATADGKDDTCTVTVTAPLTNAQVLKYLNDNYLIDAVKSFGWNTAENIKDEIWYISKDENKITEANIFTYYQYDNFNQILLLDVKFANPITPQNIRNNKIEKATYSSKYSKGINTSIQTEHKALTNAICDKLFGTTENEVNDRYIIENGSSAIDPLSPGGFQTTKYFIVIEITDTIIKEQSIAILLGKNIVDEDNTLIANLADSAKYRIGVGSTIENSYAVMGTRLSDNEESFATDEKTPLGNKVTDAQLLNVLNSGYKAKYIENGYDESWYVNRDKDGNLVSATLMYYTKSDTKTYYCHQTLTFCGTPFTYDDYLNAEKGIYQDVACVPQNSNIIEDTATLNLHPTLVQAALKKRNVELSETKKLTYVRFVDSDKKQERVNGVMTDVYTLTIYVMEGEQRTSIVYTIKAASSDAGLIANLNNDLCGEYGTRISTSSITPAGEKLVAE